jgi:hypothetical protein
MLEVEVFTVFSESHIRSRSIHCIIRNLANDHKGYGSAATPDTHKERYIPYSNSFIYLLFILFLFPSVNITISHMTRKLIHFLVEDNFEIWAVTSFGNITGMEICFFLNRIRLPWCQLELVDIICQKVVCIIVWDLVVSPDIAAEP